MSDFAEKLISLINKLETIKSSELEKEEKFNKFLDEVSSFYQEVYNVDEDEVTILLSNKKRNVLSFAKPDYLRDSGFIPMTSPDSMAVKSIHEKKAKLMNHIASIRHANIFESVKHPKKYSRPIQMMMIAPIFVEGVPLGAIEVVRKGNTKTEAGDDFSQEDFKNFVESVKKLAPYFLYFTPEDFRGKLISEEDELPQEEGKA